MCTDVMSNGELLKKGLWEWIEIQCNCQPILFVIWASNYERALVGPTCPGRYSGSPRHFWTNMPHKGAPHMQMRSVAVNHFMPYEVYFPWSTENIFKIKNILCCTKQ